MNKRRAAVLQSGLMEDDETVLGDESAVFTVAPGRLGMVGGFVVQTDRAIYMCVQGALGLGKVKEVHRLAVDDVYGPKIKHGRVSRDSWDVGFLAQRAYLTIGSVLDLDALGVSDVLDLDSLLDLDALGVNDVLDPDEMDVIDARAAAAALEGAKFAFVVVSFRSAEEGQRWASLWNQALRRHHEGR